LTLNYGFSAVNRQKHGPFRLQDEPDMVDKCFLSDTQAQLLEGRRAVLHPLVQFDEEVGLPTFDLAAGVQLGGAAPLTRVHRPSRSPGWPVQFVAGVT
jgi:hypothetical protein